jgi:hypothetical protein
VRALVERGEDLIDRDEPEEWPWVTDETEAWKKRARLIAHHFTVMAVDLRCASGRPQHLQPDNEIEAAFLVI